MEEGGEGKRSGRKKESRGREGRGGASPLQYLCLERPVQLAHSRPIHLSGCRRRRRQRRLQQLYSTLPLAAAAAAINLLLHRLHDDTALSAASHQPPLQHQQHYVSAWTAVALQHAAAVHAVMQCRRHTDTSLHSSISSDHSGTRHTLLAV